MKKTVIIIASIATVVSLSVFAGAKKFQGHKPLGMIEHVLDRIDANENQREQIDVIISGARGDIEPVMEQSRENRQALRELILVEEFDQQAIADLADTQGDLLAQQITLMAIAKNQVFAVLTQDQRDELTRMYEKHASEKSGRHHRHGWKEMMQ